MLQNKTKLKLGQNSNYDKTQIVIKWWQKSKTHILTNFKNSNCDKTKKKQFLTKLKWWQNLNCDRTPIVTKLKLRPNKKLKFWKNSKTQFVTKLKNSNCDKTSIMTNLNSWWKNTLKRSFNRNILTPSQTMICSLGRFSRLLQSLLDA